MCGSGEGEPLVNGEGRWEVRTEKVLRNYITRHYITQGGH